MALVDFYFDVKNLSATAQRLQNEPGYPLQGQPLKPIEQDLITKALKLFTQSFGKLPVITGSDLHDASLQVSIWKGFGAVYAMIDSASGPGLTQTQLDVPNIHTAGTIIAVDFWMYVD